MSFLLDTNVLSEWVKPRPSPHVVRWLTEVDEDRVFISVASVAEIRYGIDRLPAGQRRERLTAWLADDLPARFDGRILDIDRDIANTWGSLMASSRSAGIALSAMDGFFAATAVARTLTLVTGNIRDFAHLGLPLLDPFAPPS